MADTITEATASGGNITAAADKFAPCHALLGSTAEVVRCGRPESHEMHNPSHVMAHVFSPEPPDADDPFRYEYPDGSNG